MFNTRPAASSMTLISRNSYRRRGKSYLRRSSEAAKTTKQPRSRKVGGALMYDAEDGKSGGSLDVPFADESQLE